METFVKHRPEAPGAFAAEAAGLAWLRVPGGARVVDVLAVAPDALTLARVVTVPPTRAAAEAFGAALAVTHTAGAPAFGSGPARYDGPSFIGPLAMSCEPEPTWGRFYAAQRIRPYVRMAAGRLGPAGVRVMNDLGTRLDAGMFDDGAPPARLHGDLWSGNVLFAAEGVTLIDPSAHGGHRLTDLAMLALFGAPHLARILAAYDEADTWLPDGWRDLLGLHQVYPLLVHTVLFGGSYAQAAVEAARAYV